jgi:hypothetical protein
VEKYPPHPPFKFTNAAFAAADLVRCDGLNTGVPDETLEAVPFPVRLGRLDLIPGDDGKARLFGAVATLATDLGFAAGGRAINREMVRCRMVVTAPTPI